MDAQTAMVERRPARGMAVVGWAFGALVVAVALSFVTNILFTDVLDAAISGVVPEWIEALGTGLIIGGGIGLVIGSRVDRSAVFAAAVTTVVYLALWPFGSLFWSGRVMLLSLFVHLFAAMCTARLLQLKNR